MLTWIIAALDSADVTCQETARHFATALDVEDYETARACLAADCVYHAPGGVLIGPGSIVASYPDRAEAARGRFEALEYDNLVEAEGPAGAVITFTDRVRLGGAWHAFRCRQHVCVGRGGLFEEIRHEELPGERERLRAFEARAGREGPPGDVPRHGEDGEGAGPGMSAPSGGPIP
jgi:hypothetical protein